MNTKPLKIGTVNLPSNILQAPLAGYTDHGYRELCCRYGATLCYTEMISAKGLFYKSEKTQDLLVTSENEKFSAVQIFGSEPSVMRSACESEHLKKFDIIDINMGCPVPKLNKNGEGCILINDLTRASYIINECAKSGKNITVKTRIGLTEGKFTTVEFVKMAQDSGAKAVTVHGRVRDAYYSGNVNFEEIYKAKCVATIPIIANGGIFDEKSCNELYEKTACDGVMIARGSMGKPEIFSIVQNLSYKVDKKEQILTHLNRLKEIYDDRHVSIIFRKHILNYLKGLAVSKEIKNQLTAQESTQEIIKILNGINF